MRHHATKFPDLRVVPDDNNVIDRREVIKLCAVANVDVGSDNHAATEFDRRHNVGEVADEIYKLRAAS